MGLLLGSTAHHVIHHTEAPVVVVRGELRVPVRTVVVGVDQGKRGRRARRPLDQGAALGAAGWPGPSGSRCRTPTSCPPSPPGRSSSPGLESEEALVDDDDLVRHAIEQATDGTGVPPNGAQIVPVFGAGTGAFALIEASREADLVVVGTRGRRGLVELVTGSTSLDVTGPRPLPGRRHPLTPRAAALPVGRAPAP